MLMEKPWTPPAKYWNIKNLSSGHIILLYQQ